MSLYNRAAGQLLSETVVYIKTSWNNLPIFLFIKAPFFIDKTLGRDMNSETEKVQSLPPRFVDLKRDLLPQDEESKARLVAAWNDLLEQLKLAAEEIKTKGSSVRYLSITVCNSRLSQIRFYSIRSFLKSNFQNCRT